MIGWIKNVLNILPQAIGQGASALEKLTRPRLKEEKEEEDSLPVAETEAKSKELLKVLSKTGQPLDNLKLRINIRRKVKKNLASFYDMDDIPEEITEKLVEAAQSDPFYKKWFR